MSNKKQNPFKVVGAYYHADEQEQRLTSRLDYIPFQRVQAWSERAEQPGALKAQGFETTHANDTAQMKWQKEVYNMVEAVCRSHGLWCRAIGL